MKFMLLIRTCKCASVANFFLIIRSETLCCTIIDVQPSHQQRFLKEKQQKILAPQSCHCNYYPLRFIHLLCLIWKEWDHLVLIYPIYLWGLHQLHPMLTKTCEITAQKRPPRYHLYHRLVPNFTAVPYIGHAGINWWYYI